MESSYGRLSGEGDGGAGAGAGFCMHDEADGGDGKMRAWYQSGSDSGVRTAFVSRLHDGQYVKG